MFDSTEELAECFETNDDEHCHFDRVVNKKSARADIHAFLLLDTLFPSKNGADIVGAAEHDKIWINIDTEDLCEKLTEEHVIEILRCGFFWDSEYDCLSSFV